MLPRLAIFLFLTGWLFAAESDPAMRLAGDWYGTSVGVAARTHGKDEEVIFHIAPVAEKADQFVIDADKIVDGRTVNMGRLVFLFDRKKDALTCDSGPGGLWVLNVDGPTINGTLTSSDGTLLRHLSLQRQATDRHEKKNG